MSVDRKPPHRLGPAVGPEARDAMFGAAVSEGRDAVERLKQQLRDNERIWTGFRRIEVRMIGAHSLHEFMQVLVTNLPGSFPSVDCVSLACFDPEYELTRLLQAGDAQLRSDGSSGPAIGAAFVNITQQSLSGLFGPSRRPRLGPCEPKVQALLFPNYPQPLGSMALAPLVLRDQLIGALNQGSLDPRHFPAEAATDLLEHLAAVTAMCLDNAVSHERLRVYGLVDPLTGVANRRFFERRLGEEIERWSRRREPLVYMLVDIDHFKKVNDSYGHQAGDQVLQQVAELLGRDLRGADLLARYGGEEFVMLLPATTAAQGEAIAQRLCTSVARHRFKIADEQALNVSVSIGVACLDGGQERVAQPPAGWLFQQADVALYQAKQAGRNRIATATAPPISI